MLTLYHEARGGDGGDGLVQAGDGGHASSVLRAHNPGGGPIEGVALAVAGNGGNSFGLAPPGLGGSANSAIHLSSATATVLARSEATAGRGGVNDDDGRSSAPGYGDAESIAETAGGFLAEAESRMTGKRGTTSSKAVTSGGAVALAALGAQTSVSLGEEAALIGMSAKSLVAVGDDLDPARGATVVSRGSLMPTDGAVNLQLMGDPNVKAAYAVGASTALSLVTFNFNPVGNASITRSASAVFDFDVTALHQGSLVVGLLDPVSNTFEADIQLQLAISRDGALVVEQNLGTLAEALSYFNDRPLDLGAMTPGGAESPDLSISLAMSSPDLASEFSVTMLVASVGGDPAEFESDFDNDGDVDGDDLVAWGNGFGASGAGGSVAGDSDGDMDADGRDFLTWQRQLGAQVDAGSNSLIVAIPEPSAVLLSLLGLVGGRLQRGKRVQAL